MVTLRQKAKFESSMMTPNGNGRRATTTMRPTRSPYLNNHGAGQSFLGWKCFIVRTKIECSQCLPWMCHADFGDQKVRAIVPGRPCLEFAWCWRTFPRRIEPIAISPMTQRPSFQAIDHQFQTPPLHMILLSIHLALGLLRL